MSSCALALITPKFNLPWLWFCFIYNICHYSCYLQGPSLEAFCPSTLFVPALLLVSWALSVTKQHLSSCNVVLLWKCRSWFCRSGWSLRPCVFYGLQVRLRLLGHRPHLEQLGQILALSHFLLPAYMSYYHILFFLLMNCKQVFFSRGYCAGACL